MAASIRTQMVPSHLGHLGAISDDCLTPKRSEVREVDG